MRSPALLLVLLSPLGISALSGGISTDATCGGVNGYTCQGSTWGNCCSQYGWCGKTTVYCGTGCNPAFGTCTGQPASSSPALTSSSSTRSSSAAPSSTQAVSKNSRCGPSFKSQTCLGSTYGDCCSQYGYCGSTSAYCAADTCQKGFGKCNSISSSSSTRQSFASSSAISSVSPLVSSSSALSLLSSSSALPSVSSSSALSSVSSSPTSPLSASASAAPSSTSESGGCFPSGLPMTCSTLTGPLTQSCPMADRMCKGGYFVRCNRRMSALSTQISNTQTSSNGGDVCAASCTGNSACVAFSFGGSASGQYSCILYSDVVASEVDDYMTSFWKVCSKLPALSSSVGTSSAASTAQSSANSAVSSTPVASSTSIASSTTPVSISSSTPSPSASTCPYYTQSECMGIYNSPITGNCPASDRQCHTSGYYVACGRKVQSQNYILEDASGKVSDGDACVARCSASTACVAVDWRPGSGFEAQVCKLHTKTLGNVADNSGAIYRKLCGFNSAINLFSVPASSATSSSLSTFSTITTPASSATSSSLNTFSTITTPASSSSAAGQSSSGTPTLTPTPSSTPSPSSDTPECRGIPVVYGCQGAYNAFSSTAICPMDNEHCNDQYRVRCGKYYASTSAVAVTASDGETCVAACEASSTCVAASWRPSPWNICRLVGPGYVVSDQSNWTVFERVCTFAK